MARIVVVGSGVVGTATGKGFLRHGHDVEFIDIDRDRLDMLRSEGLDASAEIDLDGAPAFVFLTLPTPSTGDEFDLRALRRGTADVGMALRESSEFHTIVSRSTVPPGTLERVVEPLLAEHAGGHAGERFATATNPEFLRAACALEDFLAPWVTVIGSRSRRTTERLRALYAPFGGRIAAFDDPAYPEFIKCAHNVFNATKISFWNEMWLVGRQIGLDADEVAEIVAQSAEGSFNPAYGIRGGQPFGGACLPKDTTGFYGFAASRRISMPLLQATIEVNDVVDLEVNGRKTVLGHRTPERSAA